MELGSWEEWDHASCQWQPVCGQLRQQAEEQVSFCGVTELRAIGDWLYSCLVNRRALVAFHLPTGRTHVTDLDYAQGQCCASVLEYRGCPVIAQSSCEDGTCSTNLILFDHKSLLVERRLLATARNCNAHDVLLTRDETVVTRNDDKLAMYSSLSDLGHKRVGHVVTVTHSDYWWWTRGAFLYFLYQKMLARKEEHRQYKHDRFLEVRHVHDGTLFNTIVLPDYGQLSIQEGGALYMTRLRLNSAGSELTGEMLVYDSANKKGFKLLPGDAAGPGAHSVVAVS